MVSFIKGEKSPLCFGMILNRPLSVADLKQFCKHQWAKIPPQRHKRLIASYHKRLITVFVAKGGTAGY